ncbi:MAG: iron-sulfur cluster carrier protein ApbC [Bacteroidetes bacterium]|nr:MAG: iron-sulfur cluster carrier protein ApbC [Bacteroidota bacterium]
MNLVEKDILKALSTVEEPDLKKDLVSLGMIKDIMIDGSKIGFTVVLTTPACPLKELIKKRCIDAIQGMYGAEIEVVIKLTAEVSTIREGVDKLLPKIKNIIAIASGKGGVGKSTVTSNLAVALSKAGARVGLIDADISGPSIPTMFGVEKEQPNMTSIEGKNFIIPLEKYGVELISIGVLVPAESAVTWRGPMVSSALRQFITDVMWGDLDYLLIDLPPGTGDIHLTLVQTLPITGAVIVTTPQKVATYVPILGVVENMSYFTPEELPDNKYYIFGKGGGKILAEKNNVPFLGEIPLVQSVREGGDSGMPVALQSAVVGKAFEVLAQSVAQQVAIRNATLDKTKKVEIAV